MDYRVFHYQAEKSDLGAKTRSFQERTYHHPLSEKTRDTIEKQFLMFTNNKPA